MAELSNVHVKITGDSSSARAAVAKLQVAAHGMQGNLDKLNSKMKVFGPTFDTSSRKAVSGLKGLNREMRTSRFHSANLFAQFQDIGVMIASGQSPFILAAQQGSQISQVLQSVGSTGKSQFAALAGAARAFISPMNLITVGAVALVAALAQWGIAALSTADNTEALAEDLEALKDEIKSTTLETQKLVQGLDSIAEARIVNHLQEARDTLEEMQEKMQGMVGPAAMAATEMRAQIAAQEAVVAELEEALQKSRESREEQEAFKKATDETAEAERLLGEQIQEVLRKTAMLKLEMQQARDAAMEAAREFMKVQEFRSRFAGEEMVMGQDVLQVGRGDPEPDEPDKKTGGTKTDRFAQELERLQEQLATELELEMKSYDERQEMLEQALEQKYITQKEYAELSERLNRDHQEKMAQIDVWRHGSTLQQTEAFLGQMAGALATGNEKMLQLSKAFGAAEALINAWRTYNQVMADPSLPWFAKIPAAVSLLGNALNTVNAIKGVGSGGTGATSPGAGGGGAGSIPSSAGGAQEPQRQRSLTLIGDRFNRQQAIEMAEFLNEGSDDGLVIRGRR